MKKCKNCGLEKELSEFYPQGKSKRNGKIWYRGRCKVCHNSLFQPRTGRPNAGWFKKGNIPIYRHPKGFTPWNKGKKLTLAERQKLKKPIEKLTGISRRSIRAQIWRIEVLKKCDFKCQFCGRKDKLEVHHIIPFNDSLGLRFDIENGIVYCKRCHNRIERTKDVNNI